MRLLKSVAIAMMIVGGAALLMQGIGWFVVQEPATQNILGAITGFVALVTLIYLGTNDAGYGGSN